MDQPVPFSVRLPPPTRAQIERVRQQLSVGGTPPSVGAVLREALERGLALMTQEQAAKRG